MSLVSAAGSLLSSLLFKLKHSQDDAEGFLLGDVQKQSVENITDSQSCGIREEKRISVQSFVYYLSKFNFYDHLGRPDVNKIKTFLADREKNVIGWFSYRRNSSHRLSLRERALHGNLMTMFPGVNANEFLCALITDQVLDHSVVYSTEYSFFQWIGSCPKRIPVEVLNLRGSVVLPYRNQHNSQLSSGYSSLLGSHERKFLNDDRESSYAHQVETLYKSIMSHLEPLRSELIQSTAAILQVAADVERLQVQVDASAPKDIPTVTSSTSSIDAKLQENKIDEAPLILIDVEIENPVTQTSTAESIADEPPGSMSNMTPPGSQDLI